MRKITLFILFSLIAFVVISCKNAEVKPVGLSSLAVLNAVPGGADLSLNTTTQTAPNNGTLGFTLKTGQEGVKLAPVGTTTNPYYNNSLITVNGDYYSLFLAGSSPAAVDAILIKEKYKNYTDSLCGVRFINLSANSDPISVNITGHQNGSEINNLMYKSLTVFKQYPAQAINASYDFEIRDAATGDLITTYTLATPLFHNVTIALCGLKGSEITIQMNHF